MIKKHHELRPDAVLQRRLGVAIKMWRKQLKITQKELAARAEIHRTYVADVERGARNVTLRTIANLATSLQVTIGQLFAHITAPLGAKSEADVPLPTGEVRNILLVEHNVAAAALTERAFQRAKLACPLKIVRDGETAFNYLFGCGPYARRKPARPQLILLAFDLPKMTGEEFLRRIKGDERTRDIPVVLLSVRGEHQVSTRRRQRDLSH